MTECDAAVVGGGVAGTAAALAIGRAGRRVIVIEAAATMARRVGETLDPAARPLLESLGVWNAFAQAGHIPCPGMISLWGSPRPAEKDFIFNPYGQAWQLDRANFDEMLLAETKRKGISIRRGQSCEHFGRVGDAWEVNLADETLCATWLIDATGRRASIARRLGFKREILDRMVAIHRTATATNGDQDGRLFLEARPEGWWYSALIPSRRRVFSFQTDADLLPARGWRDDSWNAQRLSETTLLTTLIDGYGYIFGAAPQLTSAHSGRLERFVGDGWLAVGDAAMSFDPLSGQGILNAIRSGLQAAEVVIQNSETSRAQFEADHELTWQNFVAARRSYYENERRWCENPFWLRRCFPMH